MAKKQFRLCCARLTPVVPRLFGALFCLLALSLDTPCQGLDDHALNTLEREAIFLLLEKDLGSIADKLAAEHATTVTPLLQRLFIYSRAGHDERLHQTLEHLARASDWQSCMQPYFALRKVKSAIRADDLVAWRLYYERLCPRDAEGAEAFLKLWEQQGDVDGLDRWLVARSSDNDEWFKLRVYRLAKLGTAEGLLDTLAASVRANPRDLDRANRYLLVNNWAGDLQNVAWLADVCDMTTAYEHYELGQGLQRTSTRAAARLFQKALTVPFTERDAQLVRERGFRHASMMARQLNWEKQLSFWIKRGLAETYQALQRPQDAQPLVEELVAMNGDDIVTQDVHQLAGSVQAGSGQRVVEAAVLRDEMTQRETAKYWLERANYYRGREEYEIENDTYRKALEALPHRPKEPKASVERLTVVRSFTYSLLENRSAIKDWRARIERLLRLEFTRSAPETQYAFQIARLISDSEFELEELRHSLLVAQPGLLIRLLAPRTDWGNDEEHLIENAVSGDRITLDEKNKIWMALEGLVSDPGSSRAYHLARAMTYSGSLQRAVPLLLGCLKAAKPGEYFNRNEMLSRLIEAYCQKGACRAAEELLFTYKDWSWQSIASELGVIAFAAAQRGETSDALRLWKLKANLDRRDLSNLEQLSRTEAKPALRAFYEQMKKDDPLTSAPDLALRLLN